jgi:hypothetical protein
MSKLAMFTAAALAAAAPADAEDLPVRLKDGATWSISAEHVRSETRNGARQGWTLNTVKQLRWTQGADGGGRLTVRPISAEADGGSPAGLAQARSLAAPATLQVAEDLSPLSIVNLAEVRAAFAEVVGQDIRGREALADQAAMAMIASELSRAAAGQGSALERVKPLVGEDETPNPFGGPPLLTHVTYTLDSYDAAAGRARVSWRRVLDADDLKRKLSAVMASANMETLSLEISEACTHEIDIPTGLAVTTNCSSETKASDGVRQDTASDRWTITQSLPMTTP